MKRLLAMIVLLALPFSIVAQGGPIPAGQQAKIEWDHSGCDVDGNAETLAKFQLAAFTADGLTVVHYVDVTPCGQGEAMTCEEAITSFGLSSGVYQIRVRAVDVAGNVSEWSESLLIAYEVSIPSQPSKPRVKITVVVEL